MAIFDATQFVQEVRRVTARLKKLDARRAVFGSSRHKYGFAKPLAEKTVADYELRHGIALPLEYRAFVTGIGNGGAGPFYGVLGFDLETRALSAPWPYTERYEPQDDAEFETDPPGAIVIAEYGCGIFILLIVNGPQTGEVWWDARFENGFVPLEGANGARVRFDTWWLEHMRSHLSRFERVRELMNAHTPHEEIHHQLDGPITQLSVDETMASLLNVSLEGIPKTIPDKPWGVKCGLLDEHYTRWLERGGKAV